MVIVERLRLHRCYIIPPLGVRVGAGPRTFPSVTEPVFFA